MNKVFKYQIGEGFGYSEVDLKGFKKYYIEGYVSTIDKDKAGEIVDHSAQLDIYNQIKNENITLDLEHMEWYDEQGKILPRPKNSMIPVAKIVDARIDDYGVWVKAELNTNLSKFNELWGSIKDGFLKAFSIAFYPVEKVNNVIKRLNLVNVTLTGSPVNPNATFSVVMKNAAYLVNSAEGNNDNTITSYNPSPSELSSANIQKEESKMENDFELKIKSLNEDKEKLEAELKSLLNVKEEKEKLEAELKSLLSVKEEKEKLEAEVKGLKAELEKPQMKAMITETPEIKNTFKVVDPLKLIK